RAGALLRVIFPRTGFHFSGSRAAPARFLGKGNGGMKAQYVRLMDLLHRLCMIIAGFCLVAITLMIPWGVFTRYVLNAASSWPEPMAVLMMIWFSFLAACICYRENLHIGVAVIPMMLEGKA